MSLSTGMHDPLITDALLAALRAGGEALDRGARGPEPELRLLREAGLLSGGLGAGAVWGELSPDAAADMLCARLIALGSASLPLARLYEGHVNALCLLQQHATPSQRALVDAALARGALLGVWGADSDLPVFIEPSAAGARLRGTKAYASGLGYVEFAIVTAATPDGLQMVLAQVDDPGRAMPEAWDVDGMVGSLSGRFQCDGLPAMPDQRVGQVGALFEEPAFHGGVWRIVACCAGAMHRLAQLCSERLEQRGGGAAPVLLARLGGIAIDAQAALLWARHAAFEVETQGDRTRAITAALFALEATEQAADRLLAACERLLGATMHARSSEAGRIARDLRFYLRQADLDGKLAMAVGLWQELHSGIYRNN